MQSPLGNIFRKMFVISILLGLFLIGCQKCPPICPCPPYCEATPNDFDSLLTNGDYNELLNQANQALENDTPYLTETRLYRGLALLALGEIESAAGDFSFAYDRTNELITIDQSYEMDLLYRNYMVASILSGNRELGVKLRDAAIDLGYTSEEIIMKEYEDALRRSETN